jgi:aspartate/methionine/tyrosine aminotransferase
VTPGAKMMIFSIIQSIVDPGDEVICPDPSYPAYEAAIRTAGGTPVPVKLEESKQFRFDLDELARRVTQ